MGTMASAAANDVSIGLGLKPMDSDPRMDGRISPYERRTEQRKAREREAEAARAFGDYSDNSGVAQSNRYYQDQARRSAMNIAPVAAAPSVPDPNAIGATEQALLDQQKTGRSSTIETSAKGLLSDEDDTRKKRSLMNGLIS
jgi:hypothetical protein